ncbi:SAM-dependent methyltransferase [Candidatus Mycobacterium wuenschmannii]|uniref:SAM-dependent methyltransferase n=1 Tax=Candidatus Mycobacterium wuenschmannii TaxID=3027808 RepID=A0ABY8W389_9MYCO|nr:SAM-dependent methyltransferase [Candidatus Mycobacterium wuenschmannii]WIM88883.1 SAM-dependent methyltransferase [Candidatus Mycobacterium wuenschmannii]
MAIDDMLRESARVVLIAPHPDDESLALGATLSDLAVRGVPITVVFATHGGSHPQSLVRRAEAVRAITTLSPRVDTVWWDLPDGALADHESAITDRIAELIDARTLLLAPVECDGHGDHEAVARAAYAAARRRNAVLLCYAVWLWHWAHPDHIDWARVLVTAPSLRGLRDKRAAVDCYSSQLRSADGFPIVGASSIARARRLFEAVLLPHDADLAARVQEAAPPGDRSGTAEQFDAMMADGDTDPWKLDSSLYERRRLDIVLACLGRRRYRAALEIGCATGQLSDRLHTVCDEVVGLDVSERALDIARTRNEQVRWVLGAAPWDIPDERFDLIVLSEVGYFLDGPDLLAALRAVRRSLRRGGEIVIANWRRSTSGIPLDGPLVNEQAAAVLDLPRRAQYLDADLAVDIWGSPVSVFDEGGSDQ